MTLAPQVYLVGGMLRDIYITGYHGQATPTVQLPELTLYCYLKNIPVPPRLRALEIQVQQVRNADLATLQEYFRSHLVDCSFSQVSSLLQAYHEFLVATELQQASVAFCRVFESKDYDWDYALEGFTFAQLQAIAQYEPRLRAKAPFYLRNEQLIFVLNRRETKTAPGFNGFTYDMKQVSVAEDCQRRDLTINAFYLPLFKRIQVDGATNIELVLREFDKLIDSTGQGFADLEQKILRPVHQQHFLEDPIRGLRALYFAQVFSDFTLCDNFPFAQFTVADLLQTYHKPVNVTNFYWNKFLSKGLLSRVLTSGVAQGYFNLFSLENWQDLCAANSSLHIAQEQLQALDLTVSNIKVQLPARVIAKYRQITQRLEAISSWLDKILGNYQWLRADLQQYVPQSSVLVATQQAYHNCLNRLKSSRLHNTAYGWLAIHQYAQYILECYFFKTVPQEWNAKVFQSWLVAQGLEIALLKKLLDTRLTETESGEQTEKNAGQQELIEQLRNLAQVSYQQLLEPNSVPREIPLNSLLDPHELEGGYEAEEIEISLRNQLQLLRSVWVQDLQQLGLSLQYELDEVENCLISTLGLHNNLLADLSYYLFTHGDENESVLLLHAVLLQSFVHHYQLGFKKWLAQEDFSQEIAVGEMEELPLAVTSLLTAAVANLAYPLQLTWHKLGY